MPHGKRMDGENRQTETRVLTFCRQYIEENGFAPSYREIGDSLNILSTGTVKDYMDRLRAKGEIIGPPGIPRAFRMKDRQGAREFVIGDISEETKKISRSVQIRTDIYERLKALENAKRQYTKSAILNQLLDVALKIYGY